MIVIGASNNNRRNTMTLREQLRAAIRAHKFMGYMLPRQSDRDAYGQSVMAIQEMINQTACPFTWKELEAFKNGTVYPAEMPLAERKKHPHITVQYGQLMDEWFDGYDINERLWELR